MDGDLDWRIEAESLSIPGSFSWIRPLSKLAAQPHMGKGQLHRARRDARPSALL